jgi:hypothetical protein
VQAAALRRADHSSKEFYQPSISVRLRNLIRGQSPIWARAPLKMKTKKTWVGESVPIPEDQKSSSFWNVAFWYRLSGDGQNPEKSYIVWDITPCSQLKVNRRFGGTCHLHLQGRRIYELSKKPAWKLVASRAALKMELIFFSERWVDFQRTTRLYIAEDRNRHNDSCENLKSYTIQKATNTELILFSLLSLFWKKKGGSWDHLILSVSRLIVAEQRPSVCLCVLPNFFVFYAVRVISK